MNTQDPVSTSRFCLDLRKIHISNRRITSYPSNTGAMVSALFIEIALSGAFLGESA